MIALKCIKDRGFVAQAFEVSHVSEIILTRVGPYKSVTHLARGGSSEILKAVLTNARGEDKFLVLKRLRHDMIQNDRFFNLVMDEAKISLMLKHQNIVQFFDFAVYDNIHYLVMEYMDAKDLYNILVEHVNRNTFMPFDIVCYVIARVACGLHYAHELTDSSGIFYNLVHRDISPQNILFCSDGSVKIADFGIAKTCLATEATMDGFIKGKFNYMSPEQARGERLDRRSDIYSLGIVLYECLAGTSLYPEMNMDKLLPLVKNASHEKLSAIRRDIPQDLIGITEKAMHPDKDKRYINAMEMRYDLENYLIKHSSGINQKLFASYLSDMLGKRESVPRVTFDDFEMDQRYSLILPLQKLDREAKFDFSKRMKIAKPLSEKETIKGEIMSGAVKPIAESRFRFGQERLSTDMETLRMLIIVISLLLLCLILGVITFILFSA